jgi:hypothetical protein
LGNNLQLKKAARTILLCFSILIRENATGIQLGLGAEAAANLPGNNLYK